MHFGNRVFSRSRNKLFKKASQAPIPATKKPSPMCREGFSFNRPHYNNKT